MIQQQHWSSLMIGVSNRWCVHQMLKFAVFKCDWVKYSFKIKNVFLDDSVSQPGYEEHYLLTAYHKNHWYKAGTTSKNSDCQRMHK